MSDKNHIVPYWLKRTQENSWEAEILLSGLVLFALLQIPQRLSKLSYLIDLKVADSSLYELMLQFSEITVQILISGFIIHLIFRGIWVGIVGLSYVYPKGPEFSNLKASRKYRNILHKLPTPVQSIIKLEKACSLIFSTAFLMAGYAIGLMIFFTILVILGESSNTYPFLKYVTAIFFLTGMIYFIDFISGGFLKRIKWFSFVYYPIYRFFGWITLAFLYRSIYYTLITHIKKWKIYTGAILYVSAFVVVSNLISFQDQSKTESYLLNELSDINRKESNEYDNLRGDNPIEKASIQSDVISADYLRLFIVHEASMDDELKENSEISGNLSNFETLNKAFNTLYQIQVDDSLYTQLSWQYYNHPKTREPGITTILNITDLPRGYHKIMVFSASTEKDSGEKVIFQIGNQDDTTTPEDGIIKKTYHAVIPFYKTIP